MIIIFLVVAVILSSIVLALVLNGRKKTSVGASSATADGERNPATTFPPIDSIVTMAPSTINRQPPTTPASGQPPTPSPTNSSAVEGPTASPTTASTNNTFSPTASETSTVAWRLEELSRESMDAWLDPNSPQTLAVEWLISDEDAETYSDLKLTQRYALACLFYSTNGENWSKSSLSWLVEWSDECTWWGIECNSSGGIRIINIANENLSGPLPPEIHLLSDTLEELYLNANRITGTIPGKVSRLTKLRRLQLTGNLLTGSIPTSLGSLVNLRLFSVKNNNINGFLPSEMGALTLLRKFKTYADDDQVKPGTYSRFIFFLFGFSQETLTFRKMK
jgi:hypothetical protein